MNNIVKSEKHRILPITALVTGIISVSILTFYIITKFLVYQPNKIGDAFLLPYILFTTLVYLVPLILIAAIVCGSIDLKKIKAGPYAKKGKNFDIAGIILGGASILLFVLLCLTGWPYVF